MLKDSPEYLAALKREHDRELCNRKTAQGLFESGFVPIDFVTEENSEVDRVKSWLSDGCAAVERMIAEIDDDETEFLSEYNRKKRAAARRLKRNMPHSVPVFLLICRNGKERKESIACLAEMIRKQKYEKPTPRKRGAKAPKKPSRKRNILDTSKKC